MSTAVGGWMTPRRTVAILAVSLAACVTRVSDREPAPEPTSTRATPFVEGRRPLLRTRSSRGYARARPPAFELDPARWSEALEALIGGQPASVSVAIDGRLRFSHLGDVARAPASNEKLLLSMALLDRFGARSRIATTAAVRAPERTGVVHGNVWLVGNGDPGLDGASIERLAARIARTRVARIAGSIVGDTSTFRRERWAPGWHRIALSFVSVPTALTFDGNADASGFVLDPEHRAAAALTAALERLGVVVRGPPAAGPVPPTVRTIAGVRSAPLVDLLRRQNTSSLNLDAEVLGKRLGAVALGGRGSIAKGARAIRAWAARQGVRVAAHDASGLSYADRLTTNGLVRLLSIAEDRPWGRALRSTLPRPGVGTLARRLAGIDLRAKTGTLLGGVSALSGWVRTAGRRWAAFSILSAGMPKDTAVALEDAVVRFLAGRA
jgi:D-alanyl-D-alanine carboxypeptidase/D-alanyl-D-alanine-endopeptidase (penicillin-binding protein 4)